jgi:hypothetical protein
MFAFLNSNQSCYMDTVLVCMFVPTDSFDFMLDHPQNKVAAFLSREVSKLGDIMNQRSPWVITGLRNVMGNPWNTNSQQSAVDFFHALLDTCGMPDIGSQTQLTTHILRDDSKPPEVESVEDTFRVHTVIAGFHKNLTDAFHQVEHIDHPTSQYKTIISVIRPQQAPTLVFEVGRNASRGLIKYGEFDPSDNDRCTLVVGDDKYTLAGVACRRGVHYVGFIWMEGWYYYNDLNGELVLVENPEEQPTKPSRYGELFFYYL